MRLIPIQVKPDLRRFVVGEIVASNNPLELSEDMVEVDLPSGVLIYAGWYDRDASGGSYRIYVERDGERLIPPLASDDAHEAAIEVATLAAKYQRIPSQVWWAPADTEQSPTVRIARSGSRLALVG